ncbi:MAG: hypothetical protein ACK5L3_01640, partial [Oscillospiraceae bacterium]
MIKKIFLVFKTHFDFGFTNLAQKVLEQYSGQMLQDIIHACVDTAELGGVRFVFTLPAWPLQQMLNSGQQKQTLERLIRQGQVVWHALPFTSHTDFAGIEDMVDGFKYARRLSEAYGKPVPVSAKLTDVPGHGLILPALLAGAGVKFLHLGCNEYAMPPSVPPLFFWQAPDGSRVLTMYYKDGYGDGLLLPEDWPFPVWMAMLHTHDNSGPQSPAEIRRLVEEVQAKAPGVEVVSGSMDDFYRELAQCDLSGLPVVTQDLADTWIHGIGSYPKEVGMVRAARRQLLWAGAAAALSQTGAAPLARPALAAVGAGTDAAFEQLAMFDEHTWGLDVKTWMQRPRVYGKKEFLAKKETEEYRYMEASWQEQKSRATQGLALASKTLYGAMEGQQLSVLNPGAQPFTGWAEVEGGQIALPTVLVFGRPHVFVQNLPPLSVTPLAPPPAAAGPELVQNGEEAVFQNHRYRVCFSPATGLVS